MPSVRRLAYGLGAAAGAGALALWRSSRVALGARASGERLARMQASPHWRGGHFVNDRPIVEPEIAGSLVGWLASEHTTPDGPLPLAPLAAADLAQAPASGLRVTWFGHASALVEIGGQRVLVDPVWSERASPLPVGWPRRFHPPPIALEDLPALGAVVVSHDHYHHLDYPTVVALAATGTRFVVPLGVGAHLEAWGIPAARITECSDRRQR